MIEEAKVLENERQNLLLFIWRNRKIIGIITIAAMILSLIVSFLITPIYRSTAIVFPTATSTVSFSEQRNAKAAAMDFGEEEQAEQMVQILQSSRIRDKIISQFDLMNHYEIEQDDPNKFYNLMNVYSDNIQFQRTRYGSIQIDVWDRDAKLAAEIANKIVDLIDTVKNNMVAERTWPAFDISKRKKQLLDEDLKVVLVKMDSLADLGVVSLEGRTNLFQAFIDARNNEDRLFLKKQIDVNLKYGAKFDALESIRDEKIIKLEKFMDAYEQTESDANAIFNHKFVVERAVVADKKDKPKRLIIILLSTVGAFVFSVFALLLKERFTELKKLS